MTDEITALFGIPEVGKADTGVFLGGIHGTDFIKDNRRTGFYLGGPNGTDVVNNQGKSIAIYNQAPGHEIVTLGYRRTGFLIGASGKVLYFRELDKRESSN